MARIKCAAVAAVLALAVFQSQAFGQVIDCAPLQPDPCGEKSDCVTLDDRWQVTVDSAGQIFLSGESISRKKLERYAAAWAKEGTWPIVVRGLIGTKYTQVTSIVAMLRKAGVGRVSCVAPPP